MLTSKEKKTIIVGAIVAGLTLLIAYVVVPLGRKWVRLGSVLRPKLQYVERLRERAREQNALLARRNELVGKLGSVLGSEATPPEEKPKKPKAGATQPKPPESEESKPVKGEESKPAKGEESKPPAEEQGSAKPETPPAAKAAEPDEKAAKPEKKPERPDAKKSPKEKPETAKGKPTKPTAPPSGISLATHLERIAKKSGISLKKVTQKKPSACWKGTGRFNPIGLQVGFDANVKSLTKLLYALEKGERLARVERVEFRRDLKKGQNIQVTLHVVGYESVPR